MSSFDELKRNSAKSLEKLNQEAAKLKTSFKDNDDRFWQPTRDKSGNGYAVVRFLPAPQGEDVPWVRVWNHGFQGPGGWYIENSLTTLGKNDPVGELNNKLWNSTKDDESPARKQVRNQKRKLSYISNVLIIKDPANSENEGKVKLYKYGAKIFDKLNNKMNPPEEFVDEEAVNPFDLWAGCNLRIKIRTTKGPDGKAWPNYDESEFDKTSAVAKTDEDIEKIWKSEFSLQAFLAPDQFKSYAELKDRLDKVLGRVSAQEQLDEIDRSNMNTPEPEADGKISDEDEEYFKQFIDE